MDKRTFYGTGAGSSSGYWKPLFWIDQDECYELWKVTGAGNLIGLKRGDVLTVGGTLGNYTFKVPNTTPYQTYDTDNIWFKIDKTQRTVTEAEIIGHDYGKTIVKYSILYPYYVDYIMILSSAFETARENEMRDQFQLSIWWSGVFSFHGYVKGNKPIAQKYTWNPDQIVDADGNVYTPVFIGTQTILLENLKTAKYRDGSGITNVGNNAAWAALTTEAYCWYNNDINNKAACGAMYNWWAVNNAKGIAPVGYHVMTAAEWDTLITYLGGLTVAGGKLKSIGTTYWQTPNTGADNSSGFTGGPWGQRLNTGAFGQALQYGIFWTNTQSDASNASRYILAYNSAAISTDNQAKKFGLSVRCIKD